MSEAENLSLKQKADQQLAKKYDELSGKGKTFLTKYWPYLLISAILLVILIAVAIYMFLKKKK